MLNTAFLSTNYPKKPKRFIRRPKLRKRKFVKAPFSTIKVDIHKKAIEPVLTPPFQILKELVDYTNEVFSKVGKNKKKSVDTFEKGKKIITTVQKHEFLLAHSKLRCILKIARTEFPRRASRESDTAGQK